MADQTKRRTRASAPKVRTGCITCKLRHVKCDERKPICLKCEYDEVKCDGYKPVPPSRQPKTISRRDKVELPILSDWNVAQLALYPELAAWSGQADLFRHFRTSTITDFLMGFGTFEFWHTHVLPLAHSVDSVKYALCALGGVHLQFKTRREPLSARSARLKLGSVVIQLYNQAIQHMRSYMSTASQPNLKVVLVCCMIFTCIENLQGRYKEAFRHLQAASSLVDSIQQSSSPRDTESDTSSVGTASVKSSFIDEVTDLIFNLGQDASYFTGDEIVPKYTCKDISTVDTKYPRPPLATFAEAESSLRETKMVDNAVRFYFHQNFPRPKVTTSNATKAPPPPDEKGRAMWRTLMAVMDDWLARFEDFRDRISETKMTSEERIQLQSLSLARATWSLFKNRAHLQDDPSRNDAGELLDIAEGLYGLTTSSSQPVFTPSSNLVAAICLACERSPRFDIKWRCVGLLRKIDRKEGIWDSQEMADLYEGWIMAQEKGLLGEYPLQVPQLAKLLSTLKITTTPSQAILSLSEE